MGRALNYNMAALTGAIKNALEKGESIEQASQSFLNAGYSQEEVQSAINEINFQIVQSNQASPDSQKAKEGYKPLPSSEFSESKKTYLKYALLAIIIILILSGAAVLGLFWDKLF
jgi:hypothetical protein